MTREYFAPKCRVFEFGCGTGSMALVHAPYVAQIDATDLSSEMIGIAQRVSQKWGAIASACDAAIGKAPHVAVFARDDLIIDLTEAGFEIIHL